MNATWPNEFSHCDSKYGQSESYSLSKVKQEVVSDEENEDVYSDNDYGTEAESDYYNEDSD